MLKSTIFTLMLSLVAAVVPATTPLVIAPGSEMARERLNTSPRHGEWADVQVPGAPAPLKTWVVYPERKDKAPVVIVIHEIYGLTDWIRAVADQLAADGFIALAPDLLSGRGPGGGATESFPDRDAVTQAVRGLDDDFVTSALNAVRDYGLALPAAGDKFATVGFCWGGTVSFRYATLQPDLDAAVVYYGTSPKEGYERIKAPVLGLYGENDNRVNATIPEAREKLEKLKKSYTVKIFAGAGHGFLRQQDGQEGANLKAAQEAWPLTVEFLREHTR